MKSTPKTILLQSSFDGGIHIRAACRSQQKSLFLKIILLRPGCLEWDVQKKCDMYTWCEWTWPDSMSSLSKNPFRNWIFWDFALAVRLVDPNAWTRQVRIIGASFFAQSWVQLVNRGLCTRLAIIVHQLVHTQNIPKHIKGFNGCYQSSRSEG